MEVMDKVTAVRDRVYKKRGVGCRLIYLMVSILWYLVTTGGRFNRNKIVVLCYHGVRPEQKQRFEWQVKWINRNTIERIKGYIWITFDDAFSNLLDNALPILEQNQIPAAIFVVSGNLGAVPRWTMPANHPEYNEKTMTAQQLKGINKELFTIGSHTQTHPDLSKLLPPQVFCELYESKKNLEQLLGKPIEDIALPHGAFNRDVLRIAEEAGYKRIYTLEQKRTGVSQEIGTIGRFSMSPDIWKLEFILTCTGAYAWLLPWRRILAMVRKQLKKNK